MGALPWRRPGKGLLWQGRAQRHCTASPSRSAQGLIAQTLKKLSEEERFAFEVWPFLLRFHVLNEMLFVFEHQLTNELSHQ